MDTLEPIRRIFLDNKHEEQKKYFYNWTILSAEDELPYKTNHRIAKVEKVSRSGKLERFFLSALPKCGGNPPPHEKK